MSNDRIAEIRARHEKSDAEWGEIRPRAHDDRAKLLAEVEKLRAENARLRAQVAEYFREPETHPVEET